MKTIFKLLLVSAMLIPFSCSKESVTDPIPENLTATQAKGKKHAVPISARLSNIGDPNQQIGDFQACFDQDDNDLSAAGFALGRNILSGTMTHLGKLQPGVSNSAGVPISGSFGTPISCLVNVSFDKATTVYQTTYVGANGDEIHTVENVTLIFNLVEYPDYSVGTFEGTIEIVGGTGRFANATGHMVELDATFGPEGSSWRLEGEITY